MEDLTVKDDKIYQDNELFSGEAYLATTPVTIEPNFPDLFLPFYSDSVVYVVEEGNLQEIYGFKRGVKFQDIKIEEIEGDIYHHTRYILSYKYFPDRVLYEVTEKNTQKHGAETYYYKPEVFSLARWIVIPGGSRVKKEIQYENGKKSGSEYNYNKDGVILSRLNYKNNRLDGQQLYFYQDGETVKKKELFKDGYLTEGYTYSYNNKVLSEFVDEEYKESILEGEVVYLSSNGIKTVSQYRKGEKSGIEKVYFKSGDIWQEVTYSHGVKNGPEKRYFLNGELGFEGNYESGRLTGTVRTWYEGGTMRRVSEYSDEGNTEQYTKWYKNGILAEKGEIYKGSKVGPFEKYYSDGKPWKKVTVSSKNGQVYSTYNSWFTDGNKAERYTEIDSKKDGVYEQWWPNGNKRLYIEYFEGRKHGLYKNWLQNGNLYREWSYLHNKKQ